MHYRNFLLALLAGLLSGISDGAEPTVSLGRIPDSGLQPQIATGSKGDVHLIYFTGDPKSGDILYRKKLNGEVAQWSQPLRVNSQPKSAVAIGTIRGPHLALGKSDQIHVVWNGSSAAEPKGIGNPAIPEDSPHHFSAPLLYTHMNQEGDGFEEQRNLMTHTYALDGGGSIAADKSGNVYAVWHANTTLSDGSKEADRAVWVAKGKKYERFRLDSESVDRQELIRKVMGPSGNLRAPTLRLGKKLVVGFHPEMYQELFGGTAKR